MCHFLAIRALLTNKKGLHKEPSKFPDISPVDVHVRRQLWWNLVSLDAQVAFASGLPPIINNRFYDVQPISELSESAINSAYGDSGTQNNGSKQILRAFLGGKFEFYRNAGDFLHSMHNNLLCEKALDELLQITRRIQQELHSRREQITSILQASRAEIDLRQVGGDRLSGVETMSVQAQFTKMVLSMLAAKPYAVMYGPVRRHELLGKLREKEPK